MLITRLVNTRYSSPQKKDEKYADFSQRNHWSPAVGLFSRTAIGSEHMEGVEPKKRGNLSVITELFGELNAVIIPDYHQNQYIVVFSDNYHGKDNQAHC